MQRDNLKKLEAAADEAAARAEEAHEIARQAAQDEKDACEAYNAALLQSRGIEAGVDVMSIDRQWVYLSLRVVDRQWVYLSLRVVVHPSRYRKGLCTCKEVTKDNRIWSRRRPFGARIADLKRTGEKIEKSAT